MYFFYYIPVGVNVETRKFPTMTVFYSLLCLLIFAFYRYLGSLLPIDIYNLVYVPGSSSVLSAITAAFVHLGYLHLLGNLVYLILFGRYVEDRMGPVAFTLLFLSSAGLGNWLQGIYNTHVLGVSLGIIGASGAVAGVLGAFAIRFLTTRIEVAYWVFMPLQAYTRAGRTSVPSVLALLLWFLLQALEGLSQLGGTGIHVAYVTHLSGFIWGILFALGAGGLAEGAAEARLRRAKAYMARGQWYAAQGALLRYLKDKPADGEAYAMLARSYLPCGDTTRARSCYQQACRLLIEAKLRGRAEDVYAEAVRGDPSFVLEAPRQLDVALGLERNLKPELAVRAYENFERRYPFHPEAPFALVRAANLYRNSLGDGEGAVRCYRRLIEAYPEDRWVDFAREEMRLLERVV